MPRLYLIGIALEEKNPSAVHSLLVFWFVKSQLVGVGKRGERD